MTSDPEIHPKAQAIQQWNDALEFRKTRRTILLGLGSNMGNRLEHLEGAVQIIENKIGPITAHSQIYETAAWGVKEQDNYLNMCISVSTDISPLRLYEQINAIELAMGRKSSYRWGPRIIDIDILAYGHHIISYQHLKIPHERMAERKFVLVPLQEIAAEWVHPVLGQSINQLLMDCEDDTKISLFEGKNSI